MNNWVKVFFTLIVLSSILLRFYKLDTIPPSLNWDEVAAGYNAYTIANWGRDEWGNLLPLVFTSFRDDKHPIYIYITAPFVKTLGLSDFSARFPSALVGVLTVIVIFFLAKELFKSDVAGLFAALFLSVSPYHLQFSRGLWEVNFALFFFLLGLMLFFYAVKKGSWQIIAAYISFGLSLLSYHSSKIIIPSVVILITVLYYKNLLQLRKFFYVGLAIFFCFLTLLVIEPRLLGLSRAKQTRISEEEIKETKIFKSTGNKLFGSAEFVFVNYQKYFFLDYLFFNGDQSPRNSVKVVGEFYKIDAYLILMGFVALVIRKQVKVLVALLAIVLLAPIPGAISTQLPSATRGLFMMGSLHLFAAYGAFSLIKIFKLRWLMIFAAGLILVLLSKEVGNYLKYYYKEYAKKEAIEWQYGMKEIVQFVNANSQYRKVYMDIIRQQPYIFFLFYSKTQLPDLLQTVKYDESEFNTFNTVRSYSKFQFGGWDWVESQPIDGVLYVLEPAKYTGLRHKDIFKIKKVIKYPDGTEAFYLVSSF